MPNTMLDAEFKGFMIAKMEEMVPKVNEVHEVLFIKRNGKEPITAMIDRHESKICSESDNKKFYSRTLFKIFVGSLFASGLTMALTKLFA